MEFIQANWVWLLLGAAVIWFLLRRGGCSVETHGSHESDSSQHAMVKSDDEHAGDGKERPVPSTARRSRHGCC